MALRLRVLTVRAAGAARACRGRRSFSATPALRQEAEREKVEYDVVIVGAGPAGLSAAIKLKQLAAAHDKEVSVCVVEKGHEVGAHILSGNVFEPRALNELIPDWKDKGAPLNTPATEDHFHFLLNDKSSIPLPVVPMLHNDGNFICSLGQVVRWLGTQAEELGVEIFPGTPAAEVLYSGDPADPASHVVGIATADVGIGKDGQKKDNYSRGMEIRGKQTLVAEGARGSVAEDVMLKYKLREGVDPQTYGIGLKEVWRIPKDKCRPGYIQHTLGWPLDPSTYGGSFLYHMGPDLVLVGFVVGLDYPNPYTNPYAEFQRFKHHPKVAQHLEGGECIQYGARVINEGGLQSIPKLTFPGGLILGCSAGFLNVPKIKGTHMAMKSGMVAGQAVFDALTGRDAKAAVAPKGAAAASDSTSTSDGLEVVRYQKDMEASWVWDELRQVRNFHPSFKAGLYGGMAYSGLSAFLLKGREPWTFRNSAPDSAKTQPAASSTPITYPKPDGVLSFDLLTNLQRSGVNHEHDQPPHLKIRAGMETVAADLSYAKYAGPEARFCPAKVYEYPEPGKLVINAQNCVHCKTCAIKTPGEYIQWRVPEAGGGGPAYELM